LAVTCLIVALESSISCTVAAATIRVACIGEHTTHSHAFPPDNREAQPPGKQEYPAQLQTLLGAGYEVRNFGDCCASVMGGYTVAETHPFVAGTNAGDGVGYQESLAFLPDVVIIGSWSRHDWGLNKAPEQVFTLKAFEAGYEDLIGRYQALASHPKIFVSLPIPILFGQGDVPDEGVKTNDVLPVVRAIAEKHQLPIVDLFSPFLNHKELFKQAPDPRNEGEGEHVTDAGLTVIANAVFATMQQERQGTGGLGGAAGAAGSAAMSSGGVAGMSGANSGAGLGGLLDTSAGSGGFSAGTTSTPAQSSGGQSEGSSTPPQSNPVSALRTNNDSSCALRKHPQNTGLGVIAVLAFAFLRRPKKPLHRPAPTA
jgi:hypothetical protein